jgi:hypothetical protein
MRNELGEEEESESRNSRGVGRKGRIIRQLQAPLRAPGPAPGLGAPAPKKSELFVDRT